MSTEDPSDLIVLSPSIDPFEKRKKGPSDNKKHANREGRAPHHLPKIRNALSSSDKWSEMKKEDYEYPGFSQSSKDIAFCKNIKEMKGFGSHQRPHFMWDENQLSKRHTTTKKCQIRIEGKKGLGLGLEINDKFRRYLNAARPWFQNSRLETSYSGYQTRSLVDVHQTAGLNRRKNCVIFGRSDVRKYDFGSQATVVTAVKTRSPVYE